VENNDIYFDFVFAMEPYIHVCNPKINQRPNQNKNIHLQVRKEKNKKQSKTSRSIQVQLAESESTVEKKKQKKNERSKKKQIPHETRCALCLAGPAIKSRKRPKMTYVAHPFRGSIKIRNTYVNTTPQELQSESTGKLMAYANKEKEENKNKNGKKMKIGWKK
jgi:hypothetical protein